MSEQLPRSTQIIPYLFCDDVAASMEWLARVFGLTEQVRHATARGIYSEMHLGGCRIMLGAASDAHALRTPRALGSATQAIFVHVPDVLPHHARSVAADAGIQGHWSIMAMA